MTHLFKKANRIATELGLQDLSKVVVNGEVIFDVEVLLETMDYQGKNLLWMPMV